MFELVKLGRATCRLRSGERLDLRCKRTGRRRLRLVLASENTLELELVGDNVQLLTDCVLLRLLE